MSISLNFPVIMNADDYHEFGSQQRVLESILNIDTPTTDKKPLPAISYIELGYGDGYTALFYSPRLMGRKIKNNAELLSICAQIFGDEHSRVPEKKRQKKVFLKQTFE